MVTSNGVIGGRGGRFSRAALGADSLSLLRNSVAFSAGTVVRMSLGFLTWVAAARLYPASQVGVAAAAISVMMLCIEAGLLGVDMATVALFPEHRRRPGVLLDTAITLAALTGCVSSLVFLGIAATGLRALHVLTAHPLDGALFVALTVCGSAWWVMDQAAVAMARSPQVLVRAVAAGGVTLAGVVVLGATGWDTAAAILLSWVAAAVVACAIGAAQLRRATVGHLVRPRVSRRLWRRLVAVGLPNFALSAADNAPVFILPLVAAEAISRQAAAYWYAVWMMAFAAYTIPLSFGLHLFAEIAREPGQIAPLVRRQLRTGVSLAAAATVALIVIGPFVLALLGHAYASHGATPLRLAALAAVPMVVMKAYLFTCRGTGRLREGTLAAAATGLTAVGLAAVGASSWGLTGIAGAWLAVQSVAGLAAAVRMRVLASSQVELSQRQATAVAS